MLDIVEAVHFIHLGIAKQYISDIANAERIDDLETKTEKLFFGQLDLTGYGEKDLDPGIVVDNLGMGIFQQLLNIKNDAIRDRATLYCICLLDTAENDDDFFYPAEYIGNAYGALVTAIIAQLCLGFVTGENNAAITHRSDRETLCENRDLQNAIWVRSCDECGQCPVATCLICLIEETCEISTQDGEIKIYCPKCEAYLRTGFSDDDSNRATLQLIKAFGGMISSDDMTAHTVGVRSKNG